MGHDMKETENDKREISDEEPPQPTLSGLRRDLTLLCLNELFVGGEPLRLLKKQGPLFLRYETDGIVSTQHYLSPASWRAKILFDLAEGKNFRVLEMDLPGRFKQMFPNTLLRRLLWHSRPSANFPPVARFYDPDGEAEILLTRSRLCGNAVDALHNLSGAPRFQPLWISDLLALRPMAGIELVRDEQFSTTVPISRYIQAAAVTGRVVKDGELKALSLKGKPAWLPSPPPSRYVAHLLEHVTGKAVPQFEALTCTIDDDYDFR